MTTRTTHELLSRYLNWRTKENTKELPDVTIGDMLRVQENEDALARDLEAESKSTSFFN